MSRRLSLLQSRCALVHGSSSSTTGEGPCDTAGTCGALARTGRAGCSGKCRPSHQTCRASPAPRLAKTRCALGASRATQAGPAPSGGRVRPSPCCRLCSIAAVMHPFTIPTVCRQVAHHSPRALRFVGLRRPPCSYWRCMWRHSRRRARQARTGRRRRVPEVSGRPRPRSSRTWSSTKLVVGK